MEKSASIRTASQLLGWEQVKNRKNIDVSMIESPEIWLFVSLKGVYYPYEIA